MVRGSLIQESRLPVALAGDGDGAARSTDDWWFVTLWAVTLTVAEAGDRGAAGAGVGAARSGCGPVGGTVGAGGVQAGRVRVGSGKGPAAGPTWGRLAAKNFGWGVA